MCTYWYGLWVARICWIYEIAFSPRGVVRQRPAARQTPNTDEHKTGDVPQLNKQRGHTVDSQTRANVFILFFLFLMRGSVLFDFLPLFCYVSGSVLLHVNGTLHKTIRNREQLSWEKNLIDCKIFCDFFCFLNVEIFFQYILC